MCNNYALIATYNPHPPRLVVGGDYEGGVDPSSKGILPCMELLLYMHIFVLKEIALKKEIDNCPLQIPYYTPLPPNLGR